MLHVSLRTVQLWVEAGVLKAWKTDGGHRRLPLSSVQALIKERLGESVLAPPPRESQMGMSDDVFSIFVLENDENMLNRYRMTMLGWNMPVRFTFVASVYQALIEIGRRPPDLLITDLDSASVDGLEVLKVLRADASLSMLNIVLVSSMAPQEMEARGGLPADIVVFSKPLSFELIQGFVKACLSNMVLQKKHLRGG